MLFLFAFVELTTLKLLLPPIFTILLLITVGATGGLFCLLVYMLLYKFEFLFIYFELECEIVSNTILFGFL